jgi:hypothetical protein
MFAEVFWAGLPILEGRCPRLRLQVRRFQTKDELRAGGPQVFVRKIIKE